MKIWKISFLGGNMALVKAKTKEEAKKYALMEFGRISEPCVSEASDKDIEFYKSMNGYMHEA